MNSPYGRYGAADYTTMISDALSLVTRATDPQVLIPRLKAQLAEMQATGAPAYELAKVQAELKAQQALLAQDRATSEAIATWNTVGQGLSVLGAGVLLAGIAFLMSKALDK